MASTVSLIQMLASGMVTSAGAAVASGKVRFYLPGTLTPVSVYSDIAAATPISPPLTLTAGGTGIAYTKVPTRVIVKDSTETTTYYDGLVNIERAEQLYIQSASVNGGTETTLQTLVDAIGTSFGGTAGLWKFKAGTGGTERNYVDVINDIMVSVKSFGADSTGVSDSAAAIQNAVNFVASVGAGVVFIPVGTYLIGSAITISTNGISIVGQSRLGSIIRNTNATGKAFDASAVGATSPSFSNFTISHSSASSTYAIQASATGTCVLDRMTISSHNVGLALRAAVAYDLVITGAAGGGASVVGASDLAYFYGGTITSTGAGDGLQATSSGTLWMFGTTLVGGSAGYGIQITGASTAYLHGVIASGTSGALKTAATTAAVFHQGCFWNGAVTDQRTGAPVAYSIGTTSAMTPLPAQADTIRVIGTAGGITITINAATALGFGRGFWLVLINSSGGAVTWAFNAQYKLQGGAAPNPATGNLMISRFEYDAVSSVYREASRSASIAI